jgi:hypothetical protein
MSSNSNKVLYLPSTPLNVLLSCAIAIHRQENSGCHEVSQLWLIDQKNTTDNPYFKALQKWQKSPFDTIKIFSGGSKTQNKLAQRQEIFSSIAKGIKAFLPTEVAVGSDRRIEFQYVMHLLQVKGQSAKGLYLDDGLYSYAGRPHHFLKDGINAILKKFVYGSWWQEPKTVGSSSWIDQAWLFAPEQAIELLKQKALVTIKADWFKNEAITELSHLVALQLKYDISHLHALDTVLLIPHPNNVKKMQGYKTRIQNLIAKLHQQGKKIGVKYHPRAEGDDELDLRAFGATEIIPAQLAFEFCLPLFSSRCKVVGDIGTALLTCKWLRPELIVFANLDENDSFQKKFISISHAMGIKVNNQIEDAVE